MIEEHVVVETPEGDMSTFIVRPQSDDLLPTILFLMDAPGKREELHDMARRIAATGYYVMLPNLYYRDVPSFTVHREDPVSARYMAQLMANLSNSMVARDAAVLLNYAANEVAADENSGWSNWLLHERPICVVGRGRNTEKVKATASIHGVKLALDTEDSPHKRAEDIAAEVLVMAAEFDDWVDRPHFDRLVTALDDAGTNYNAEWIDGVHHGLFSPNANTTK